MTPKTTRWTLPRDLRGLRPGRPFPSLVKGAVLGVSLLVAALLVSANSNAAVGRELAAAGGAWREATSATGGARYIGRTRQKSVTFMVSLSSSRRPSCFERWATGAGLLIGWQAGQEWATVTGAPGAVDRDFAVTINDYRAPDGRVFFATPRPAAVPSLACGEVSGVGDIHSAVIPPSMEDVPGSLLDPVDLLRAYDALPLIARGDLGRGRTIVFIETDGYTMADLATFATKMQQCCGAVPGEHPLSHYGYDITNVGGDTAKEEGEAIMDLETAHEIAPEAHLVYVNLLGAGPSTASLAVLFTDAIGSAATHYPGAVFSISLGFCETAGVFWQPADLRALNSAVLSDEERDHVTVFTSSGDTGGLDCTPTYPTNDAGKPPTASFKGVQGPATLPAVTGVGGTVLSTDSNGNYAGEEPWSWPLLSQGSGGGVSQVFAQPSWQTAPGTGGPADYNNHRQVPDVSADADPYSGNLIVQGGQFSGGSGTSLATPIWAGFTTLINQFLTKPVGFFNPILYRLARGSRPYPPFHQVGVGGNDYYAAGPGYNMVTGLGTPDVWNLARDISAVQP